jgi:hypothetical protein
MLKSTHASEDIAAAREKACRLSLLSEIFQGLSAYFGNLVAEQTDRDCDGAEHTDEEATYKS